MKKLILAVCILFHTTCFASFPLPEAVPGGVIKIPLPPSNIAPLVYYNDHRVMVSPNKSDKKFPWVAVIGIPITAKPGQAKIIVTSSSHIQHPITFQINAKKYPVQRLTFKKKKELITPGPKLLKRMQRERAQINRMMRTWTPGNVPTKFSAPVQGQISSDFGLRRFYNNIPKSPHTGVDIAAPTHTPVKAPAPGTVIGVSDYAYTGNTVFIDHGQGLITLYAHMNRVKVKRGAKVKRGDIIGTIGQTGRATGPHLHWGVVMNTYRIDPMLFVPKPKIVKEDARSAGN